MRITANIQAAASSYFVEARSMRRSCHRLLHMLNVYMKGRQRSLLLWTYLTGFFSKILLHNFESKTNFKHLASTNKTNMVTAKASLALPYRSVKF